MLKLLMGGPPGKCNGGMKEAPPLGNPFYLNQAAGKGKGKGGKAKGEGKGEGRG